MEIKSYVEDVFMGRHFTLPNEKHGSPEELLKLADKAKDFKEGRRFLCIRKLMIKGRKTSTNEVAQDFGVTPRAVNDWVRRWNKDGKEGLKTKPRTGRPPLFKPEHEDLIHKLIDNQEKSNTRLTIKGIHGFLKE